MSLAHNGILRGLNSIVLQAPHIPLSSPATIQDFLTYCQCWCESMHHHHDAEEDLFFPEIEQLTSTPGLMQRNKDQHQAFTPGFEAFHEYVKTCVPEAFDGTEVRRLVEGFAGALGQHLHEEIETLRALDRYDSARVRGSYQRLEKRLMATDNVRSLLSLS
ncbi:hypothetical protein GQ44DRAFT_765086 [Phaeosphaeriaceae sp. PMI808]|nr:hypothetical protein GQ44DRAFT_765086 [Phaeosphaeriaceae sp. PMI808]